MLNPIERNRFLRHINKNTTNGCWEWTSAKTKSGYGLFSIRGSQKYAHRIAYKEYVEDFDNTLFVCHKCDNPSCVNPAHLFVGTAKENSRDMVMKQRNIFVYHPKGKELPFCKLDESQVKDVKSLRAKGISLKQIANMFNISESMVSKIARGHRRNK